MIFVTRRKSYFSQSTVYIMKAFVGILCLVYFTSGSVQAQQYKYHTILIYNFSRYIEWPANNANADFTVSVLGEGEAYREMVDISTKKKTIKGQNFVVRKCKDASEAKNSSIVFITKGVRIKPEDIQALQANGTLVITELEDIQSKGSHINFIATKESKLGFELNQKAATDSGFKVAGALAGLAAKTY